MLILAFSTSTDHGSVALLRQEKVLAQIKWARKPSQTQNSDALILKINALLKKTKVKPEKLAAIAVDKGPGSFTGCRIAVNVAKTFGYTLNIPVVDLFSLDAMAHGIRVSKAVGPLLAVMDAHKSLLYCRWYELKNGVISPQSSIEAKPLDQLTGLISDNTLVCGPCPKVFLEAFLEKGAKVQISYPEAKIIGILASRAFKETPVGSESWKDVEPSYIRSPEAVEKLQRK